jgi:integrase
METVKLKFRSSSVPSKEGTLFFQVTHNRMVRRVKTGCRLYPHEWNAATEQIVFPNAADDERLGYLMSWRETLRGNVQRFKAIARQLEHTASEFSVDDIVEQYLSLKDDGFVSFARKLITKLKLVEKLCTAERYTTVLNSFERFLGGADVPVTEVDSDLMVRYENCLKAHGLCPNTISYYMRGLRAVYNRAVEEKLTVQRIPFKHVYTGIGETVKRALPLNTIRLIKNLDLTSNPAEDYARDIFMFSFYTRGMSFVDMAFLKKKDLHNGILSYRRQKTGKQMFVKWEKPMREIVEKYETRNSPFLLPIVKDPNAGIRQQYKSAAHFVNDKLKVLGKRLNLPIPLTTYVARHSWASVAKSRNVPVSVISEAMGHDSEKTTRIYLASLDTCAVDKANSQILKALQR